jgi:uncharacterized protein DUF6473
MYQKRDHEIIDYELFPLGDTGHIIRGPEPKTLAPGEYFTCLGAAQTFGCFCEQPYPTLLADSLDLAALNLGFAGAGPRHFLQRLQAPLLDYVNKGRFAVVQIMSGRSEDNSVFDTGGVEYLRLRSNGERIGAEPAYKELLATESRERVQAIVAETRDNWVDSYSRLLDAIEVPTILFWFSTRSPDYEESYSSNIYAFFGEYPQLVNRSMVGRVRSLGDDYVECISSRGLPQRLYSRFTGKPISVMHRDDLGGGWQEFNPYYPSPEMHADAADALVEACRKFAG